MKITKLEDRLLPSDITTTWFAEAIHSLDLSKIPHHHRADAMHEHLMRIMAHSIQDPTTRTQLRKAVDSLDTRKSFLL